jgi:hypothetical protein
MAGFHPTSRLGCGPGMTGKGHEEPFQARTLSARVGWKADTRRSQKVSRENIESAPRFRGAVSFQGGPPKGGAPSVTAGTKSGAAFTPRLFLLSGRLHGDQ